ncbi:MAG TPA: glycogen/starch/alpha-glucan family phosphorylase, partial [Candidatus Sumerlaeota bacterium]|nr:glycogen/starch/alpha-glucan family phosphorylase [Candidatus Sumerlaeota bacterium]
KVRMANLAIVGSHAVNGVSALHTRILKTEIFPELSELEPGQFQNKTNGITPRRWLRKANPSLSSLITDKIGGGWNINLDELRRIEPLVEDNDFKEQWRQSRWVRKKILSRFILSTLDVSLDPGALFDVQVKRIHEYKRQLLNVLHVITLYNRIKDNPERDYVPRVVLFGGKAAPGYYMAKLIIKLINSVGEIINQDSDVNGRLKVLFLPNYSVSLAEKIIPASDLSEQISTAGMEASGTSNMKFALNGALTIGTLDGANVEIMEEVGPDNIFIFGLTADKVLELRRSGYNPEQYYYTNPELKRVLDMIKNDYFNPYEPGIFEPVFNTLVRQGDYFCHLADYADYIRTQDRVAETFRDKDLWTRKSILNVARMGKFSSDNTIMQYARDIWNVTPVPIVM